MLKKLNNDRKKLLKMLEEAQNDRELLKTTYEHKLKQINSQIYYYMKNIENMNVNIKKLEHNGTEI